MTKLLYFEDMVPRRVFTHSATVEVTEKMIRAFASEYDPQPFHTDPEKAKDTFFGGLAASGWHTAALTMKLMVGSELKVAGGLIGMGVESIRWPVATRPGDTLRIEIKVVESRVSKSRPSHGVVKTEITTYNQHDQVAQHMYTHILVPVRGGGSE